MVVSRQFLLALSFLTRVPVAAKFFHTGNGPDEGEGLRLSEAVWAFPLVGLLVGGIGAAVMLAAAGLGLPPLLCCLAGLGSGVIATGALHEDGLGDFCDGLGVHGKARILEVMRDSQSGSYGVLGLVFSFGWRAAALGSIAASGADAAAIGMAALALLLMHAGARGVMAGLLLLPLADGQGLAHGARQGAAAPKLACVLALVIVACLFFSLLPPVAAVAALLAALLAAGLVALIALKRIGGMTGDVYGAAEQAAEMAIVAAVAAAL